MTGHDLKVARARLDMSQSDLARVLGVTEGSISRWENSHTPKIDPLLTLLVDRVIAISSGPNSKQHGVALKHGICQGPTYALFTLLSIVYDDTGVVESCCSNCGAFLWVFIEQVNDSRRWALFPCGGSGTEMDLVPGDDGHWPTFGVRCGACVARKESTPNATA